MNLGTLVPAVVVAGLLTMVVSSSTEDILLSILEPTNGSAWQPRARVNVHAVLREGHLVDRIRATQGAGWKVCYGVLPSPWTQDRPPFECMPLVDGKGAAQDVPVRWKNDVMHLLFSFAARLHLVLVSRLFRPLFSIT